MKRNPNNNIRTQNKPDLPRQLALALQRAADGASSAAAAASACGWASGLGVGLRTGCMLHQSATWPDRDLHRKNGKESRLVSRLSGWRCAIF